MYRLRSGLERFCTPAWNVMLHTLGGEQSKLWTQIRHLLPTGPRGLLDGSMYSPAASTVSNLSKVAIKLVSSARIEQFRGLSSPILIKGNGTLTTANVIQADSRPYF